MEGTGEASDEAVVAQRTKVQRLREQLAQEVLTQQEIEAAAETRARAEALQREHAQQQQHSAQPQEVTFTPNDLAEIIEYMDLERLPSEGQPSRTEIGALQPRTLSALQAPTLALRESGLASEAEMGGRDAQRQLAAGPLETAGVHCRRTGGPIEGSTATGLEIGPEGPSGTYSHSSSEAEPRALKFSPEGSQGSSSEVPFVSQTMPEGQTPVQSSVTQEMGEIGTLETHRRGAGVIFSASGGVSGGVSGDISGGVTVTDRGVTGAKRNGRGGSAAEFSPEMDQKANAPEQQGTGVEHTVGAWTPLLQCKTPTHQQRTSEQREMQHAQAREGLRSDISLERLQTEIEKGNVWYLLGDSGEPGMAYVCKDWLLWQNLCTQLGVRTRNCGPEDEEVQAFDVVDLERYTDVASQLFTDPTVLGEYAELAYMAGQRDSPESQKVATALQNVADSDDRIFLTKVVALSMNWIHAPAEVQAVICNWAFDEIFNTVVDMLRMQVGMQRDLEDRTSETAKLLQEEYDKRCQSLKYTNKQKEKLLHCLDEEPSPLVNSVGQQLGENMVALQTAGNGHCLEAAISWSLFRTPGMAKALVGTLLETYQDPEFVDLLQLGLATYQAQNANLQNVTKEEFIAGLRNGSIWSDHPELTVFGKALNVTVIVWQMDERLGMATPICGLEATRDCTIHLILRGQHYEALVARTRVEQYVDAEYMTPSAPFYTKDRGEDVMQAHARAKSRAQRAAPRDKPPIRDGHPAAGLVQPKVNAMTPVATAELRGVIEEQAALWNSFTPRITTAAQHTKSASVRQKADQSSLGGGRTQLTGASTSTVGSLQATHGSMPRTSTLSQSSVVQSAAPSRRRSGVSQRGGFKQGPGRNSGTPTFEHVINTKTLDQLQQLDPEAVIWLRATRQAPGGGVAGRLTVKGPPTELEAVGEYLDANCQCHLALLCTRKEKAYYHIEVGSKRCIESERAALHLHGRQLWDAHDVLEYVSQTHCDVQQLFAPSDADSITDESDGSEEGTVRARNITPLGAPKGAPSSAAQSTPPDSTIWSTLQDRPASVLQGGRKWQELIQQDQWQMAKRAQVQAQAQATTTTQAHMQGQAQAQAKATTQAQVQTRAHAQVQAQTQTQAKAKVLQPLQPLQRSKVSIGEAETVAPHKPKGSQFANAARGATDAVDMSALEQVVESIEAELPQGSPNATNATTVKVQSPLSPQAEWFTSQFKLLEGQAQESHNQFMDVMEKSAQGQQRLLVEYQQKMQLQLAEMQAQQFQQLTATMTENLGQYQQQMQQLHEKRCAQQELRQQEQLAQHRQQIEKCQQGQTQLAEQMQQLTAQVISMQTCNAHLDLVSLSRKPPPSDSEAVPSTEDNLCATLQSDSNSNTDSPQESVVFARTPASRMCWMRNHAQLSVRENQSAQQLVGETSPIGDQEDQKLMKRQVEMQLDALSGVQQAWRRNGFNPAMTTVSVIGTIPMLQGRVDAACSICNCMNPHVPRREATFRRGGPDAREEWERGPQWQLHNALHTGALCAKCTETCYSDDGQHSWLVYDQMHRQYRAPTNAEYDLGMNEVKRELWEREAQYSDFESIPTHRYKQPAVDSQRRVHFSIADHHWATAEYSKPSPQGKLALKLQSPPPKPPPIPHNTATGTAQDARCQKPPGFNTNNGGKQKPRTLKGSMVTSNWSPGGGGESSSSSDGSSSSEDGDNPGDQKDPEDPEDPEDDGDSDGDRKPERRRQGTRPLLIEEAKAQDLQERRQRAALIAIRSAVKENITPLGEAFGTQDEKVPPLLRAKEVHTLRMQLINLLADSTVQHEMDILSGLRTDANYELVKTIMNTVLPKGSALKQSWTKEVLEFTMKKKLAKEWSNPLKLVTTWIIRKLIVRDQDKTACKIAALREKDQIGTRRLSPQEAADIVLELRDILVALGYGSQMNIPTVGAAIESTLSDFVKFQLTSWNASVSKRKRAQLGRLPENYSEANLKKLVAKAQEFYVKTDVTTNASGSNSRLYRARQQGYGAARVLQETPDDEMETPQSDAGNEVAEQHPDERTQDDIAEDRVHALQGPSRGPPPVGPTGPSTAHKRLWQQGHGRKPWGSRTQQGFPGPAHVERSGDGSAFPAVGVRAILGSKDFSGCWYCESKEHYQRDCPHPGASTTPKRLAAPRRVAGNKVLNSLQDVTQMHDIVQDPQLALLVAIQGVSPELQSQLPQASVAAIRQYEESPYAAVFHLEAEEAAEYGDQS